MTDFATFPKKRFGLVTGSKCSVFFPLKGDGKVGQRTYAKTLAKEKFFQFYDEMSSMATEHGKMAEHFAFLHFQEYYNSEIQQGRFIYRDECGGSTDAETDLDVVDFKCPVTLQGWLDYLDGIDKEQKDQLQMYMWLTGKSGAVIAAYLIETQWMTDNGLVYPVPEEKRMILVPVEKDNTWGDRLLKQLPDFLAIRDEYIEKYTKLFN